MRRSSKGKVTGEARERLVGMVLDAIPYYPQEATLYAIARSCGVAAHYAKSAIETITNMDDVLVCEDDEGARPVYSLLRRGSRHVEMD